MNDADNLSGINMYVVSVLDNGDQRTFVSENLKILDRIVYATICGSSKQFLLADILDIVPVDAMSTKTPSMRNITSQVQ
ncbi:hypothetical protein KX729_05440 [Rhizobium sp. XQZ8]|uniref:hypothetical protein n=1 Tax=Rhizobium populisoli TaxID=2859785 RepID=UPI001CA53C3A|nr:hypothetical protein [Rhizobium populisoli]MBW6420878.1 hypothetical protein [Rhizobium populisoli]